MSLKEKIKQKIIHLCGGYTQEELPSKTMMNVIHTEYPTEEIQFCCKYFLNEASKEIIEEEAIKKLSEHIIKNKLYKSQTENSRETPELAITRYVVYVSHPPID